MTLRNFDIHLIHFFRKVSVPAARLGLFVVFFWFGFLKIIDLSPASPLVSQVFGEGIGFLSFPVFLVLFGIYECIIGILFLVPRCERVVIPLLFLHMAATFLPIFLLPETAWTGFMVPTLEGQYIIKNLVLIAAAIGIAAHLHPIKGRHK